MAKLNEKTYEILKIISSFREPVGSGLICHDLMDKGIGVSEATVGRMLRRLDKDGLTYKEGFRGRSLTEKGWEALESYQRREEQQLISHRFVQLAKAEAKEELINVLIARRAIEREIARLAAKKATAEDILELQNIIRHNEKNIDMGLSGAEDDVLFHRTIARIAGNKLLETALELIRQDGQLSPVLEYIRNRVGSTVVADHKQVLKFIEGKNPQGAEKAMAQHIESIISDVEIYWEKVNKEKGS